MFGLNQLRVILKKREAKDISLFDCGVRIVYSILLSIYSIGVQNFLFVVVNFGAALLSAAVFVAGMFMKKKNGDENEDTSEDDDRLPRHSRSPGKTRARRSTT